MALPIRSTTALEAFSLPDLTVTLSVVDARADLVSLTLSLSVRFWAGLSAGSFFGLLATPESPRALANDTLTAEDFFEPSLAILSVSVIDLLRLIVVGAPPNASVSLAALDTGTGGVFETVGVGVGAGRGAGSAPASASPRAALGGRASPVRSPSVVGRVEVPVAGGQRVPDRAVERLRQAGVRAEHRHGRTVDVDLPVLFGPPSR